MMPRFTPADSRLLNDLYHMLLTYGIASPATQERLVDLQYKINLCVVEQGAKCSNT